jgi:hypothetical protein
MLPGRKMLLGVTVISRFSKNHLFVVFILHFRVYKEKTLQSAQQ